MELPEYTLTDENNSFIDERLIGCMQVNGAVTNVRYDHKNRVFAYVDK